jgi:hypothetical protein
MPNRNHFRVISAYRELPPRIRIIYSESPEEKANKEYANLIGDGASPQPRSYSADANDIVSLVFANRVYTHEVGCRDLARLVVERRELHKKHLADVKWRLDELLERKPWRRGPSIHNDLEVTEVERQILDLEKQKRALEVALWRDTQELRTTLSDKRTELDALKRRMGYLVGGTDGA